MQISRNKYEELFLLYVDNELSAADREAVDNFVKQNPDLEKELLLLKKTVMNGEAIAFDGKNSLYKNETEPALQEKILLYLDNELGIPEKLEIEKMIATSTITSNDLLLLQTRLVPDVSLIFPDKASLYRSTPGKVAALSWRRIAAAAILLGSGIWAGILFTKTAKPVVPGSGTSSIKKNDPFMSKTDTMVIVKKTLQNSGATILTSITPLKQAIPQKELIINGNKQPLEYNQKNTIKSDVVKVNDQPFISLHKPVLGNFNKIEGNETTTSNVSTLKGDAANIVSVNNSIPISLAKEQSLKKNEPAGYALNTSFTEDNPEENNNNKILYMNEENVKKSKLGGFFRKVKRLVERTTSIKTGNGVRVAGFDIAIK